jgi:hypothetical protein
MPDTEKEDNEGAEVPFAIRNKPDLMWFASVPLRFIKQGTISLNSEE